MSLTTETEETRMKRSARFRVAMELLIKLAAMAVLARVVLPAVGALAGKVLLMISAHEALTSPTRGLTGVIGALTICLAGALLTIWLPLRIVHVCSTIDRNRRGR
jgi:hypothetical protein